MNESSAETGAVNYDGTLSAKKVTELEQKTEDLPKLTSADIRPEVPEPGGTDLVLQVNARDDRTDKSSPEFGTLTPEGARQVVENAKSFLDAVFDNLSPEERGKVDIVVFASDASLRMPGGVENPHQRAMETAENVISGLSASMDANGVDSESHILNNSMEGRGNPLPIPGWADLKMWEEPGFVDYLQSLWGDRFWPKYESNWIDEVDMKTVPTKVEVQNQIASRTDNTLSELTVSFAREYHETHPDRRLIIWTVGMYDNIAPWVKRDVLGKDPTKTFLPIEKGGGLTIKIGADNNKAVTSIGDQIDSVPSLLKQQFTSYITDYEKPAK